MFFALFFWRVEHVVHELELELLSVGYFSELLLVVMLVAEFADLAFGFQVLAQVSGGEFALEDFSLHEGVGVVLLDVFILGGAESGSCCCEMVAFGEAIEPEMQGFVGLERLGEFLEDLGFVGRFRHGVRDVSDMEGRHNRIYNYNLKMSDFPQHKYIPKIKLKSPGN